MPRYVAMKSSITDPALRTSAMVIAARPVGGSTPSRLGLERTEIWPRASVGFRRRSGNSNPEQVLTCRGTEALGWRSIASELHERRMTRISPRAGALAQRLPDPMDAAMAFRSIVLAHKRRSSPMPYALCSRLPDPMDAARIFR